MDEYELVTKDIPFDRLIQLFKFSIGMTVLMGNRVRILLPIVEKFVDTQDVSVILGVAKELDQILAGVDGVNRSLGDAQFLKDIQQVRMSIELIHTRCTEYLNWRKALTL
jgi:hypothetical protein